jgi:diguanylate cyclase (GGDEF)-like protein
MPHTRTGRAPDAGSFPAVPGLEVLGELGRGTETAVYRVQRDGSDYALKILDSPQDGTLAAFRREATLLAALDHPHLPRVHEVGTVGARPYLVMDFVAGRPLADLVAGQPLDPWQVVSQALDLVEPLAAMHRQGLVHRDLKPQNIMILDDGTARMIDFGLAVRLTGEEDPDNTTVGTLAYAPPEQSGTLKRPVDHRSDLYSLGVVLFECLTGTLPFVAADTGELLHLHATAPAPDVRTLAPAVPETLSAIVATLLAKDPDDRYQSAEALALDLGRLLENPDTLLEPRTTNARHRRPGGPLRGRDGELRQILDAWAEVGRGRGKFVVVRGTEGMGKTRLLDEVIRVADREGAPVLAGRGTPDAPLPLAPLRQAVERLLLDAETLSLLRRTELHQRITQAAGSAAGLLAGLSPALSTVLGAEPLTDADRQDQFSAALGRFVCELARLTGGLALVIDDEHLVDPATVRVLAHIAVRIHDVPLLMLCARRDDAGPDGPDAPDTPDPTVATTLQTALDRTIVLGPLTEEAVNALVADRLPGIDAGSRLAQLLLVRGHGNPFVIVEYLRATVDAGLLRPHWGTWKLDDEALDELALPEDALGLVLARVASLAEEPHRLLMVAAIAGPRFLPGVVAEAAGVDLDRALEAMADAAAHNLIELRDGGDYGFVHERIRAALVDGEPPARLTRLHRAIAEALDRRYRAGAVTPTGGDDVSHPSAAPAPGASPTRDGLVYAVAEHYRLSEVTGAGPVADRARGFCTAAGRLALAAQAPDRAVTFLAYASALRPDDSRLLHLLGTAQLRAGRHVDAVETLERALPVESDPLRRARVLLSITEVHRATWSTTEALAAVEKGLAELGAQLPRTAAGALLGTVARTVLAAVIALTGWGFASARGAQRERLQLIAALHRQGGYSGTVSLTPRLLFMHHLRALLPAVRLGPGREYALNIGAAALLAALAGLKRLSRRLTRTAERAARAVADPQLIAQVAWYGGAASYMGRLDNGRRWAACLDEHGAWLDAGMYSDAVATLAADAASQGRSADVLRWYERGRRRVSFAVGAETTSLVSITAMARTAAGRLVEADTELRRQREQLKAHQNKGLRVNQTLAEMHSLTEQDELGEPFEEVVARFFALGLNPRSTIRQHRSFFFLYAWGRLAQARREPGAERLAAAHQAVKLLGEVAYTPLLKACHAQCRAELDILAGRPDRALARLSRVPPQQEDAPLHAYEGVCTRARALQAAGYPAEAGRMVLGASAVANAHGWPMRARRLTDEFGLHTTTNHEGRSVLETRDGEGDLRTGRERQRLAALEAVSAAASRVLDPDELARVALDQTLRLLTAERAVLFLTDPDGDGDGPLRPHLGRDAAGNDVPELTGYSASLVERVRRSGEPLVVTGTEEGAALGAQSVVLNNLRSIMVAPLMLEKRLIGVVYLDSQVAKGIFTSGDVGILTALTNHIATSLETARAAQLEISVRTADRQRDLAEKLRDAQTDMSASLDPEQVLTRLVGAAERLLPGERSWLLRPETSGPATAAGMTAPTTLNTRVPEPGSITTLLFDRELQSVLAGGRPVAGSSVTDDGSRSAPPQLRRLLAGSASWLLIPLSSDGTAVGVLVRTATGEHAFAETEVGVAGTLVAQAMTAYEKATLFAQVQELAVVDELTGVSTRRHFFELAGRELNAARRHARPMTVMMVDIDHFKRVNDTHGHPTGDDVIREVAARLGSVLRDTDLIGRYGGEEFAVLLPDSDRGEEIAERMLTAVSRVPVPTRSGPVGVTVSLGLTRLTAEDAELPNLIDRADLALYAAKAGGRDQLQVR